MTTTDAASRRLRCALFVDFDNVYIGLQRLDPTAAEAFATHPGHWLSGLESGTDDDGDFTRRFLVRACYLNPSVFSQFRPNFTRAGFSVVDCPSLTQQGKSSADINLVLDAVDALAAPTFYDEFVIVSADADFTPLAHRFRAADRRVTIITASPAASAYRAVADTVITADALTELVLPTTAERLAEAVAAVPVPVVEQTATASATGTGRSAGGEGSTPGGAGTGRRRAGVEEGAPPRSRGIGGGPARALVLRQVRTADRPLNGGSLAQAAQKAEPALASTNWDGAGSFFPWLATAVPEVAASAGFVWDPARFSEADLPGAGGVDLPPLQRQVVEVTEIPNLPTERYRALLTALADDVAAHPFDRPETARRVRDACQAAGEAIGKASVNTVIAGVLYAGLDLAARPDARTIAQTWADNVLGLCRGARMDLTAQDVAAIRTWVGGGLLDR
ncbi:NYN domain-containing protein [Actinotalea sp. Marseille-Q4924]|uniref:NYN domain-containing protein n=1 Tax=Actinotalea sp. Marseille-Q4924 TaxID=2866571 RepID=UPI001CE3B8BB|nr:NYN domain-containing protein [Actinotalea sp. Marseille-Q4924]